MYRTSWQVAYREAVLDTVAGLSVTPTLQAGVFLLRRLQHVVTAQTLEKQKQNKTKKRCHRQLKISLQRRGPDIGLLFSVTHVV